MESAAAGKVIGVRETKQSSVRAAQQALFMT
jgi:hypothetical protein